MISQQLPEFHPEPWAFHMTEKLNHGIIVGEWGSREKHIISLTFKVFIPLGKTDKMLSL